MKIKHIGRKILALFLSTVLAIPLSLPVLAGESISGSDGEAGIEGKWNADYIPGEDGIRVTIVNSDGSCIPGSGSIDYTLNKNNCADKVVFHFGKNCKSYYRDKGYSSVTFDYSKYSWLYPPTSGSDPFPAPVISDGQYTTFAATKRYFKNTTVQKQVIKDINLTYGTHWTYDQVHSTSYLMMLEPIRYFTHNGVYYAGTATEIAIYAQTHPGEISDLMPDYRYNIPNAMYLDTPKGGYSAPSSKDLQNNSTNTESSYGYTYYNMDFLIKNLGIGMLYFGDTPTPSGKKSNVYIHLYTSRRYLPIGKSATDMNNMSLQDQVSASEEYQGYWTLENRQEIPADYKNTHTKFFASDYDGYAPDDSILINVSKTNSGLVDAQYPAEWMSGVHIDEQLSGSDYFISGGDVKPQSSLIENRSTKRNSLSYDDNYEYHIAYYKIIWVNYSSPVYAHTYTSYRQLPVGVTKSTANSWSLSDIMSKTTETKHAWDVTSKGNIYTSQGSKQIATFDTAIE